MVASVGAEVHPRESTRVSGSVEWVRDSGDLDRTLARGMLEVAQSLRGGTEVFGRWTAGESDSPRALSDEWATNYFALGVRTRF